MADDLEEDPGGEYVDIGVDDPDVEDTPDGGAIVKLDESPKAGESEFFANLAETLPTTNLASLATDLLDLIERDKEARKKRDQKYTEGLRRTGLGDDAPGGADFEGASKVVHPMLTEVCVDFESRAIKELWPSSGPAKSMIVGDVTKERVLKANRKSDHMNWQLTVQCVEARAEFEQMLTQLPLGGSQYMKLMWDEAKNRPQFLFVAIDDIYLPFAATNFLSAQRKTHVQYLTRMEYERRVKVGMYIDADLTTPAMTPERSDADRANDKIEGRDETSYNEDGQRTVYEVYAMWDFDGDDPEADGAAPYIITVDQTSSKVLAVYRNWAEDDAGQEELQWIVDFAFVPWRGAYGIGMIHMIGGLSGASTGALRALLDAAHIANSQTMIKLKGGTRGGQSLTISPTEIQEIEGGLNVDDIRKLAMPLPFNQPSQTLFELLGFLVEAGKGVVRTTIDSSPESDINMPVGTKLANIEQGMTVFSAIHERSHNSMQRLLAVQHRLNAMYLDDAEEKAEAGSVIATRADYNGPMDVVPVSDPRIFSEAQRFAQTQAVAQRAHLRPELYKAREVEKRILQTLKIPAYEELLVPEMAPKEENAVSENVKATLGRPIVAFPEQDHIAHLKAHIPYMQSPMFGMSQLIAPTFLPAMLGHIKEHLVLWYAHEVFETANEASGDSLSDMIGKSKDKSSKQALDRLVAEASHDVVETAPEIFASLPQVIAKAIQMVQQLTPPIPGDPAVQVAAQDVQMRGKAAADKAAIDDKKIAAAAQEKREERAADLQEVQVREAGETERTQIEVQGRAAGNHEDNVTALEIAEMGGGGGGIDPNPAP